MPIRSFSYHKHISAASGPVKQRRHNSYVARHGTGGLFDNRSRIASRVAAYQTKSGSMLMYSKREPPTSLGKVVKGLSTRRYDEATASEYRTYDAPSGALMPIKSVFPLGSG
jgi:hypothetical protein